MNVTLGVMLYSFSYHCVHSEVILSHLTTAFQKSVLSSSSETLEVLASRISKLLILYFLLWQTIPLSVWPLNVAAH